MPDVLTISKIVSGDDVYNSLMAGGLSDRASASRMSLFGQVASILAQGNDSASMEATAFFVPGRVEVLGKHTDYAGGRSMTCAIDRGFCIVAVPRVDLRVSMTCARSGETVEFDIDTCDRDRLPQWANYPMTVIQRLVMNFPGQIRGADIAFVSDLPPASGLSSSSAMITAFFLVFSRMYGLSTLPEYQQNIHSMELLASYLGNIENGSTFGSLVGSRGVGTFGGSEDHTAILCSVADKFSVFSYCPVCLESRVDIPDGYSLVIASSGVVAQKTGDAMGKYNRLSTLCRKSVEIWNSATGSDEIYPADIIGKYGIDRFFEILAGSHTEVLIRMQQFVTESEQIIPAAVAALGSGDIAGFGRAVKESQLLAEEKLGNQIPETVYLAKAACDCGAVAASSFGAGFGGSVWAMCKDSCIDDFRLNWSDVYCKQFPQHAENARFFATSPGKAAFEI